MFCVLYFETHEQNFNNLLLIFIETFHFNMKSININIKFNNDLPLD